MTGFVTFPICFGRMICVVFNNTRVFPARLYGTRSGAKAQPVSSRNPAARDFLKGRVEVLLTRQVSEEPNEWECLVRPGRKIGVGEQLFFGDPDELRAEVVARGSFGERRIRFRSDSGFLWFGRAVRACASAAIYRSGRSTRRSGSLSDRIRA